MTLKEVYAALRKLSPKKWAAFDHYGAIRLRLRDEDGSFFCPITALYYERRGYRWGAIMYKSAAEKLKLPKEKAKRIAAAADSTEPVPIRKALLAAVRHLR